MVIFDYSLEKKTDLTALADAIRSKASTTGILTVPQMKTAVEGIEVGGGGNDETLAKLIDCSITEIDIPYGTTEIGSYKFYDCWQLKRVTIPNSVEYIWDNAFTLCDFANVNIPDSVRSIGSCAFTSCYSLTSVTIGNGITSIEVDAFDDCEDLSDIYVDWSEGTVEGAPWGANNATIHYALKASEGLAYERNGDAYIVTGIGTCTDTDLVIPDVYEGLPVTSIGDYAFGECTSLTSITIPNSVTSIGSEAFSYCDSIKSVTIGNGVTSIGSYAFYGCSNLTSITIPNSVTSIGESAFDECHSLTSINIPDSVTSIGDYAFSYCDSLTSVTIGNGVTNIGEGAFYGCDNLTSIIVSSDNSAYKPIDGNLYSKDGKTLIQYAIGKTDTSFTIPDSVTSIGYSAFRSCSNLTSITIPNSVTTVEDGAFNGCDNLTSIYVDWSEGDVADAPWGARNATIYYNSEV